MIVAPTGRYSLLQRNDVSVLLDVVAQKTRELSFQAERFVFAHEGDVGYAWDKKGELVALDLATGNEKWRVAPSSTDARTLSISQDDGTVLVGAPDRAALVDTQTGKLRGEVVLASVSTSVTFLPGGKSAVFVRLDDVVESPARDGSHERRPRKPVGLEGLRPQLRGAACGGARWFARLSVADVLRRGPAAQHDANVDEPRPRERCRLRREGRHVSEEPSWVWSRGAESVGPARRGLPRHGSHGRGHV